MKKRLLSLFLALLMVAGMIPATIFTAFAEESDSSAVTPPKYYGELVVNINNTLLTRETVFLVELFSKATATSESGDENAKAAYSMEMTSEAGAASVSGFIMGSVDEGADGIAPGDYTLKISAKGYGDYVQDITFGEDDRITITLYNSRGVNDGRTENLFGVIPYGDVNGDGVVDEDDSNAIIKKMNGDRATDDDEKVIAIEDLNLNGYCDTDDNAVVDLEDLTICVRNQGEEPMLANVEHGASALATIVKAHASAEGVGGTTIQAHSSTLGENISAAAALLSPSEDSYVEMVPKNPDAPISEENPTEFALSFDEIAAEAPDPEKPEETPAAPKTMEKEGVFIASKADNPVTSGSVEVLAENGTTYIVPFEKGQVTTGSTEVPQSRMMRAAKSKAAVAPQADVRDPSGSVDSKGNVSIDLGTMVAIKKISIRITGSSTAKLAEIAKVEFLDDFASRIPEPVLNIPEGVSATHTEVDGLGYRTVNVDWNPEANVTGYEISITGPGFTKTTSVTANEAQGTDGKVHASFVGDSFNGTVSSPNSYQVKVRSTSGDWKSPWSKEFELKVVATKAPPTPESSKVVSGDRMLTYTWKNKWDTVGCFVYYKKMSSSDTAESLQNAYRNKAALDTAVENKIYTKVDVTKGSSFVLNNLGVDDEYDFAVVAYNKDANGNYRFSGVTTHSTGKPISSEVYAKMPAYKMINVMSSTGRYDTHISSIDYGSKYNKDQYWVYSDGPDGNIDWDPWALFDNKASTYLKRNQWANGTFTVKLDTQIEMNKIRLAYLHNGGYFYSLDVTYANSADPAFKDGNGKLIYKRVNASISYKSVGGNKYYEITLAEPVVADNISVHIVDLDYTGGNARYQELRLYYYDSLEDETNALFADSMHTVLKDTVTRATIQTLLARLEERDPISGELNPNYSTIKADLDYALQLQADSTKLDPVIDVDNTITSSADNGLNAFSQSLSPYQPLGYVAAQDDTVVVYVNRPNLKRGTNANLKLLVTQFHPEYGSWKKEYNLQAGRNEIQIPGIVTTSAEHGGSLYIKYTGNKGAENYQVRISGATKIPMLDVRNVPEDERMPLIEAYVKELESTQKVIESEHNKNHLNSDNKYLHYSYNAGKCILNATEISMNNMFYSVAADKILSGLGSGTSAEKAERLAESIKAMEQAIDYYYQFKGLNKNEPANSKDRYPAQRLNIRFHGMFTGAFMYAASEHIGIEHGSVSGLSTMKTVQLDANNNKVAGTTAGWGGWGIAHEIGHCINTSGYQRVEVTNNIFAQLEKAITVGETNAQFRTSYNKVYKGVVTGRVGHTGDLAVQLAMYWQLHLAYDNQPTAKMYSTAAEAQENLIYARIDAIYRDNSKAPQTEIALNMSNGDADQKFMRVVCAAAGKDVLDFFRAWGFKPDATTVTYASQFEKETRAIQYIDDDSRLYRVNGGKGVKDLVPTVDYDSSMTIKDQRTSDQKIVLNITDKGGKDVLGYEIKRNGKVVAFITKDESGTTKYTDILNSENNKVFKYTVTALDKLLKPSVSVDTKEIKVCNEPILDKSSWTITTNMSCPSAYKVPAVEGTFNVEDRDADLISALIDGDNDTIFYGVGGTANESVRPNVTISLGTTEQIAALRLHPVQEPGRSYTNPETKDGAEAKDYDGVTYTNNSLDLSACRPFGYKIEVSNDGTTWTEVKRGNIYGAGAAAGNPSTWRASSDVKIEDDGSITLYFSKEGDTFMYSYDASYIRFTSISMGVMALADIDIIGPTCDNIELEKYGVLAEDFKYNENAEPIPAGSYVFYGEYMGDPSYSAVELRDQNDVILGGEQLIFANVPEKGQLGNTTLGKWIFWMPNEIDSYSGKNFQDQMDTVNVIQAQLYRVDNAHTLENERMTSNTLHFNITKADLEKNSITLTSDSMKPDNATEDTPAPAAYVDEIPVINNTELAEALTFKQSSSGAAIAAVQTFAAYNLSPNSMAMTASVAAVNDEETSDAGETTDPGTTTTPGETTVNNSYNPFEISVPKVADDKDNVVLADKNAPMTVTVRPVNSALAMEVVITFDRNDVLAGASTKCIIGESMLVEDPNQMFTGEYVNEAKGEIRLYAVSKYGAIDNADEFVGQIILPALKDIVDLTDVNYSVAIHEVNSDNQLVATIDDDGNRVITNVYEGEGYIEYGHTMVPVGVALPTCTGTAILDQVCVHNNGADHNYTTKGSYEVAKLEHSYISVGGVVKCTYCDELLGKGKKTEWRGDWYLDGIKLNDGVVAAGFSENGEALFQLYQEGELVTVPGLYAVKDGTVTKTVKNTVTNENGEEVTVTEEVEVPVYYPVYVMSTGYLATGTVQVEEELTLTYDAQVGDKVEEKTLTLSVGEKLYHKFTANGRYVESYEDKSGPTKEQLAKEAAKNALIAAADAKFNGTATERVSTAPAASALVGFKSVQTGSLPAGVTFEGTTIEKVVDKDGETIGIRVIQTFKAKTAAYATKYLKGMDKVSSTSYKTVHEYLFSAPETFDDTFTASVNSGKCTFKYSLLSWAYDILYKGSSSTDADFNLATRIYESYDLATTPAEQ